MKIYFSANKLIRYAVAYVFITSALMKFLNSDMANHFLHLGLPYPQLMLKLVIFLEMGCGVLILINKSVKNAVIPLIGIMFVAILLTKVPLLHTGFLSFAFQSRLDIVMFILLVYLYQHSPR
ncbi:DoxX family protein [Neobacillus cucumis]|uniref:DoxX family protein n=1 Tax=Neobacillus cucumis TaxID=1740721 RepID=UPI002E1F6F38|nr:DoxX family protein [Neobacillus cucumis]